ncbi:MAG: terminase small subunit [Burkholderiales bacterium]|nr:terminase small subunit [Burkholderiales bacterium]
MNPKQARFVQEFLVDSNAAAAARRAGYSPRSARVNGPRLLTNAAIREALQASQHATARRLELDRQRVLEGLMEAIEQARVRADPSAQIRGWAEVAKLMGYYAPEVRRVQLSAEGRGRMERLEGMTDAELLALVETTLVKVN